MLNSKIKPCLQCEHLITVSHTGHGVVKMYFCGKTGKSFYIYTPFDTPHWCPNVVFAERTIREWEEEQ